MKLLILNGPNINFIGIREPNIYGHENYNNLVKDLEEYAKNKNIELSIYQSNHEGDLVDKIQEAYYNKIDGIIINPGAYTHTSIAILDALKAVMIDCVEVHISDVSKREDFRKTSYVSLVAKNRIIGHGLKGYFEAIDYFVK